ncbi:MAG: NADH-quinone oxidoreductase subunit L [Deltaproteobacteria bacterium]|nr:NADH-quinone oxidoreductase subunit L [Deltaproteobacteria bacterium]
MQAAAQIAAIPVREVSWLLLVPLLPLAGAAWNGLSILFKADISDESASRIACGAVGLAFALSLAAWLQILLAPGPVALSQQVFTWMELGGLKIDFSLVADRMSVLMLLIITGVGSLIHVYSTGYMHGDPGYRRFFTYLNLFVFFMLVLVLGSSLPVLFVGWEGVGLCSYLLIGFWYEHMPNSDAGKKAFIVNRVGDLGFLLGMFTLVYAVSQAGVPTLEIAALKERLPEILKVSIHLFGIEFRAVTLACLLLFIGATGKSAQIPLYVWLPDAMAGPTPVSALIHAATMVTAGVYMVARLSPLFQASPVTMTVIAVVGGLTAFFAATIALVQNDIKKVLAYSTVSQLGYMFLGLGSGVMWASMFHLMTHAFFKACLFLGAGSVILGMHHEQDMRKMGGLKKYMPVTRWTFLLATLAIAGFPLTSGFFSKDAILYGAFNAHFYLPGQTLGAVAHALPWFLSGLGLLTALLTAFYMGRCYFLTFEGECRADHHTQEHIHESPASMTSALGILAFLSITAGFLGIPHLWHWAPNAMEGWLAPLLAADPRVPGIEESLGHFFPVWEHIEHTLSGELAFTALAAGLGLLGLFAARDLYLPKADIPAQAEAALPRVHRWLSDKYYVDELYDRMIVTPVKQVSEFFLWKFIDVRLIDGLVNLLADLSRWTGRQIGRLQNGIAAQYTAIMLAGAFALILYLSGR